MFPPRFQPAVMRNEHLKEWTVYFEDAPSYTVPRFIQVDVHVGMASGRIVGFDITDAVLSQLDLVNPSIIEDSIEQLERSWTDHDEAKFG